MQATQASFASRNSNGPDVAPQKTYTLCDELPVEILHAVFERVLLPPCLVDPTANRQPTALWNSERRQKLSLLCVSKTWYLAARMYLYQEVSISDARQVARLLRSVKENQGLAPLIKTFVLSCYIHGQHLPQLETDLRELVNSCTNLTSFNCTPKLPLAYPGVLHACQVPSITHLWLGEGVRWEPAAEMLRVLSPRLVSLGFTAHFQHSELSWTATTPIDIPFSFPALESLFLTVHCDTSAFSRLLGQWDMPILERLTMGGDELTEQTLRMLSRLVFSWTGLAIRYLNVRDCTPIREKTSIVADIVAELPHLEHLVCHRSHIQHLEPHAKLRWIDGWGPNWMNRSRIPVLEPAAFPKLDGIRHMSILLLELPMLPFDLPPDIHPEEGDAKWSFRSGNIHVVYDYGGIDLDTSTLGNEQPFAGYMNYTE